MQIVQKVGEMALENRIGRIDGDIADAQPYLGVSLNVYVAILAPLGAPGVLHYPVRNLGRLLYRGAHHELMSENDVIHFMVACPLDDA